MKQQTSLMPLSDIYHSSPAPVPQQSGFTLLKSTRSSRMMQERTVETFQRNTWGAILAGSAIQYTSTLYALGAQICEKYPGSDALCRPILENYAQGAAGQIAQFFKW